MTRSRKMMLEELQRRNSSAITTRNYLRVVPDFAEYSGKSPDKLGPNELRTCQAYLLRERKRHRVPWSALRFFFVKTLKCHHFRDFFALPSGSASVANGTEPGGSFASDQRGREPPAVLETRLVWV